MLYDISNHNKARESLSKFTNVTLEDIENFIKEIIEVKGDSASEDVNFEYWTEVFLEEFDINIKDLILTDLEIKAIHVTTSNKENIKYIKQNGLINLQDILKGQNNITKFLKDEGIIIDVLNKKVYYKNKTFEITNEWYNDDELYRRIYEDCMVCGFNFSKKPLEYSNVAYTPEFFVNLADLIDSHLLEKNWRYINNKIYIVEYKIDVKNLYYETFVNRDVTKNEFYKLKECYIKKWLILKSLKVGSKSEENNIVSFATLNYNVPPTDILNIKYVNKTS